MEEIKTKESWNKKRIVVALIVILLVGFGVKTFLLDARKGLGSTSLSKSVIGTSVGEKATPTGEPKTSFPENFNLQKTLQQKLESLKKEVSNLNITDIASSSPQLQKALNDLKSLGEYPRNEVKDLCQKVCSSF